MGDVARERDLVMEDGLWLLLGSVVERLRSCGPCMEISASRKVRGLFASVGSSPHSGLLLRSVFPPSRIYPLCIQYSIQSWNEDSIVPPNGTYPIDIQYYIRSGTKTRETFCILSPYHLSTYTTSKISTDDPCSPSRPVLTKDQTTESGIPYNTS